MKKWNVLLLLLVIGVLALSACGKKYEPVAIQEDVDVCAICNMQVKDNAYATQIITKDGKSYKFDDIGCMNEWKKRNGTDNIGMDYVRDYNSKDWIEFSKASYVYDESLRTPMAYGVISFKNADSAKAFVAEQGAGKVLSAEELASHDWKQNKDMMMKHKHEHMSEESSHK